MSVLEKERAQSRPHHSFRLKQIRVDPTCPLCLQNIHTDCNGSKQLQIEPCCGQSICDCCSGKASGEASAGNGGAAGAALEALAEAERGSGSPEMKRSTCTDSRSPTSSDTATRPESLRGNFRTQKALSRISGGWSSGLKLSK